MNIAAFSLAAALVCAAAAPAAARPVIDTKYTYYTVSGGTAQDLEYSMFRRGPRVGGIHGYASTRLTSPGWKANFVQTNNCRVKDFELGLTFTIKLPKFGGGAAPAGVKSRFTSFVAFAKRHEETHRSIWISCAKTAERRVFAIRAKSCGTIKREINQVIAGEIRACDARHAAFDASQRGPLERHPFIRQVVADIKKKQRVAALKTKKRKRA